MGPMLKPDERGKLDGEVLCPDHHDSLENKKQILHILFIAP